MFGMAPIAEVTILTISLAFIISLVYRVFTDPKEIRRIKEHLASYREKIKKAQKSGNAKEVNKFTDEMLRLQREQFGKSFKPMMVTFLVFLIALRIFDTYYSEVVITSPFSIPFAGTEFGWFVWYFLLIIPTTMIFRKLLGVD
jgi:uncharacterized membrane protein (DUF106 family)